MRRLCSLRQLAGWVTLAAVFLGLALVISNTRGPDRVMGTPHALDRTLQGRLVSSNSLPGMDSDMCLLPDKGSYGMASALWNHLPLGIQVVYAAQPQSPVQLRRDPLRMIRDPYPSFSGIAVDMERDEVIAADENLFQILVYDRLANTPPQAAMTEPLRSIGGAQTEIEFVCGLYLDQESGEIYATHADTAAMVVVFTRDQEGNVPPARKLRTGGQVRGRGMAVDEENQELFLASQHNSAVVVFRKHAEENENPIRLLQGERTRLANPHGIAVDSRNGLIFVTNHGQVAGRSTEGIDTSRLRPNVPLGRNLAIPGSGRFRPPSITVYQRTASGDQPPLRVIEGPQTQLNWPMNIVVDERREELFVANDTGKSILVFRTDAAGDVAPIRVLKGPDTQLSSPASLFLDTKHDEMWVANYGNHSLSVYPHTADGNTPPLRVIRSAPAGSQALMIGNPGGLAYDSLREEILVPN